MTDLNGLWGQNSVEFARANRLLSSLFAGSTHTGARFGLAVYRQVDFRSLILCSRATLLRIFLVGVSIRCFWVLRDNVILLYIRLSDRRRSKQVLLENRHVDAGSQEDCLIREHKSQLLIANCRTSADNKWVNQGFIFLRSIDSISYNTSNLLKNFLYLTRQNTHKNYITLSGNLLVIKEAFNTKLLLEWSQKMGLSCWDDQLEIVELVLNLQEFGQQDSSCLATSNDTNLKNWSLFTSR